MKATRQAVAELTLQQMNDDTKSNSSENVSIVFEEEPPFTNVFSEEEKKKRIPEIAKPTRPMPEPSKKENMPHHTLPKMLFPSFDGNQQVQPLL